MAKERFNARGYTIMGVAALLGGVYLCILRYFGEEMGIPAALGGLVGFGGLLLIMLTAAAIAKGTGGVETSD